MGRPKMTDEQKAAAAQAREQARMSAQPIVRATSDEGEPQAEDHDLASYIRERERDDIVLVRVTFPGAEPHVFQGRFSGIEVADGPLSAQWADGSTE